ncbi:MAG: Stp1/IreP family PP2C-type Ser/Thr phosphatase [Deltaproteobacteria bacterium]|nr:Stp1/IreP family PP2C-type Ser/Thr phosphatase [Deltaproteobacteria bacterium]MBW2052626.1 Stp1/IreP family PP2C-type Ser/Thr phosphatase [Deltaproteobacteria bacterium]MBW2140733.1 Stp1/IreP family PP2C-type Ser/Thr phosphatase [Deltaproteobacteria bacterium]MBW2324229.1 Stp1/IreP family PP2C-type Ser/Thr phosphatase [Deltaproteobacteria bacterium]
MQIDYAGQSDPGLVRDNNEDSFLTLPEVGFFAVADGMGGHNSGEVASAMAVETLSEDASDLPRLKAKVPWWRRIFRRRQAFNPVSFLHDTITRANNKIFEAAQSCPEKKGMGTTVAIVLTAGEAVVTAHVGDSRIYRLRESKLTQLTQDHSLATELVRQGVLSPEEALYSAPKNILTRALGVREEVTEEIIYHSLESGDMLLIGSDGLTNMVEDEDIARIIVRKNSSVSQKVEDLVAAALEAGGEDNVTVVLIKFS